MQVNTFATPLLAATALADTVAHHLREAIDQHGRASLVVSGGSTPAPFLAALAKADLPWHHLTLTLADERCVPADHPDRNERMVRHHLPHAAIEFIPLSPAFEYPTAFDVVVLGMGEDGHTASLFPHHPQLPAALVADAPACLAIAHAPKPPPERLTLSAPRLLHTRHLLVHITGEAKHQALLAAAQQPDPLAYPISAFLSHPSCEVFWSAT